MDSYWILTLATFASMVADLETTQRCLALRTCFERNPLLGSHPSRGRMYKLAVPVNVGVALAGWQFKKHGVRWWWIPQGVALGAHTAGTALTWEFVW